jgi:hypothetical protein
MAPKCALFFDCRPRLMHVIIRRCSHTSRSVPEREGLQTSQPNYPSEGLYNQECSHKYILVKMYLSNHSSFKQAPEGVGPPRHGFSLHCSLIVDCADGPRTCPHKLVLRTSE